MLHGAGNVFRGRKIIHQAGGAVTSDHSEPDPDNQTQAAELLDLDSATLPNEPLPSLSNGESPLSRWQTLDAKRIQRGIEIFAEYWGVDPERGLSTFDEVYEQREKAHDF